MITIDCHNKYDNSNTIARLLLSPLASRVGRRWGLCRSEPGGAEGAPRGVQWPAQERDHQEAVPRKRHDDAHTSDFVASWREVRERPC